MLGTTKTAIKIMLVLMSTEKTVGTLLILKPAHLGGGGEGGGGEGGGGEGGGGLQANSSSSRGQHMSASMYCINLHGAGQTGNNSTTLLILTPAHLGGGGGGGEGETGGGEGGGGLQGHRSSSRRTKCQHVPIEPVARLLEK